MITVINTNNDVFDMSMSVSEMCSETNHKVEMALAEMDMNILLFEHQYLYENGVECSYTEAVDFARIKENVKKAISDAIAWIKKVFNSLIDKIKTAASKVKAWVMKSGLTEKKWNELIGKYANSTKDETSLKEAIAKIQCYPDYFDPDTIKNKYNEIIAEAADGSAGQIHPFGEMGAFPEGGIQGFKGTKFLFGEDSGAAFIKSITTSRDSTIKNLNNLIKKLDRKADAETISGIKKVISQTSSAATDAIKVYWTNYSAIVKWAKAVAVYVRPTAEEKKAEAEAKKAEKAKEKEAKGKKEKNLGESASIYFNR